MPVAIENAEIVAVLKNNKETMEALLAEQEETNRKIMELNKENQRFVDMMDAEYGFGNWQDVDAENATFVPREEFTKKYYLIQNPALREEIRPEIEAVN